MDFGANLPISAVADCMLANGRGARRRGGGRPLAEAGNAQGMSYLAFVYASGRGLARDDAQALIWYRRAVAAGDEQALQELARRGIH